MSAEVIELPGAAVLPTSGAGTHRTHPLSLAWSAAWPKLLAVGLVIGVWQAAYLTGWRPDYVLPSPATAVGELLRLGQSADFWEAVATTMQRALTGFAIAVLIGSVVGVAVARVRVLRLAIGSMITGLQTMPSIAWFPLAILLFGLTEQAILFVVVLGAAPSAANGIISGIDHIPPQQLRVARTLGAHGWTLYRYVVIPAALPAVLSGLKQGWAFAWRSLMAGELLVLLGRYSLGQQLAAAREFSDAPALLAYMMVILVIGMVVDAVFNAVDVRMRRRRGLLIET
jgi:NitT/TauT family transport system permease protein